MNLRKSAALPLVALAMALPVLAQASAVYHSAVGEVGFTEHVDHWKSTKTRAQVVAEVEAARKDGTLALIQRNIPVPTRAVGAAKTRQMVIEEMSSESPAQRRLRLEQYIGG